MLRPYGPADIRNFVSAFLLHETPLVGAAAKKPITQSKIAPFVNCKLFLRPRSGGHRCR